MSVTRLSVALVLAFAANTTLAAPMFLAATPQGFAEFVPGVFPVRFNAHALYAMRAGEEVDFASPALPERRYTFVFDRIESHADGFQTWIGYSKAYGRDYRAIITTGPGGSLGRIATPDGDFRLEPRNGFESLTDTATAAVREFVPDHDDGLIPPLVSAAVDSGSFAAVPSPQTTIDLMLFYTAGFVTQYGSSNVMGRINNLITLTNQAFIDSEVAITYRLVYSAQTSYTDQNSNNTALTDLTNSSGAFSSVATLRNTYGADLVALLRPYARSYHGNCGLAWVGGGRGTTFSSSYGYAAISDGSDIAGSGYYCHDTTFAHELGHNLGNTHDRANSSSAGAYYYSYGYGIDGTFGDIMSYLRPTVAKFSNPNITCNGLPCGISESDTTNAANTALSMNNTRTLVAAYKPTVVASTTSTPGTLQLASASSSVAENGGSVTLTVTRSSGTDGAATVNYATAAGTATAGVDFTATSGSLSWAAGESTSKTIVVPILNDALVEGNETFTVTLSGATGATLGSISSTTVTITDDETSASVGATASSYSVNEGAGSLVITLARQGTEAATVTYATASGTATAGADFTGTSGTLNWAAGESGNKTITISILEDNLVEGNETFSVALANGVGTTLTGAASLPVTIVDNDGSSSTFSATASVSGTTSNLTLSAIIKIPTAEVGTTGGLYVVVYIPGLGLYAETASGWQVVTSVASIPAYSTTTLASSHTIPIVSNANLTSIIGSMVFAGYGANATDLVNNNKNSLIYTVQ